MQRTAVVLTPLLAENIPVHKEDTDVKLLQRRVPPDVDQAAVGNVGFHRITPDREAEIRADRRRGVERDVFVILTLDGGGVACGGGDQVVLDHHELLRLLLRLVGRLLHQIAPVAQQLVLPALIQGAIDRQNGRFRLLRLRRGDGRLRRFAQKKAASDAEVQGKLLDLVHTGHLAAAAVGGDGRFADPQQIRDIDLLFPVLLHQTLEIVGEQIAVVGNGSGHGLHPFLRFCNHCTENRQKSQVKHENNRRKEWKNMTK